MIKNIVLKFRKKQNNKKVFFSSNTKNIKEKNSLKKEKEYSQLFTKILNSSKLNNNNNSTKAIKTKGNKNNNIKKITLFKPEELKTNDNIICHKELKAITSNFQKLKNNTQKKTNINNRQHLFNNNYSKIILNINKYKDILEQQKEKSSKNIFNIDNKCFKDIKTNKIKKIIVKNSTDQKIKKNTIFYKKIIQNKEKNYKKENNEIKYNLKIKNISDNNILISHLNKEKIKYGNDQLKYIFRQLIFHKNYDFEKQTLPNLKDITAKDINNINKLKKETNSETIINESLNIIDYFTCNYNIKKYNKNKTIDTKFYNKKFYPKYKFIDVSHSVPKLSNYGTEINTMSSSRFNEIYSPLELNLTPLKKLKSNKSKKKKGLIINKSEDIKIKIKEKFKKNKNNYINNQKDINLNGNKKSNLRKIIRIKVGNFHFSKKNKDEDIKDSYAKSNYHFNTDNDVGLCSEKSYYSNNELYDFLNKNNTINKESNQNNLNIERNYRSRKNGTVRNSIDNIGKKLLILVNDFHNSSLYLGNKTFSHHSIKLIDRIRAIKKLNFI